jgi:hypothetical protein
MSGTGGVCLSTVRRLSDDGDVMPGVLGTCA